MEIIGVIALVACAYGLGEVVGWRKRRYQPPDKLEPEECYCAKLKPDSRERGAHCTYCHRERLCKCDDKKVARFRFRKERE